MDFILGKDQIDAIDSIKLFLKSKETAISLTGFAGTGKSTIVREIVKYLDNEYTNYVLCAPTHVAKLVLEFFTEREAMTIHKLLSLSPNIEILNLDFKQLQFLSRGKGNSFPNKGVVICDEASMINDELFELLLSRCRETQSQIIFVGDVKQIQPINALSHSKVFNLPNSIVLSKIYRQSTESGLVHVLPILRNSSIPYFTDSIGSEGSLLCYTDLRKFFEELIPSVRKAIKNSDILETKVLSYTNNRVRQYNQKIKEIIFGLETEYDKFQFLTCYENFNYNGTNFWNSMDYIIIDEPKKITATIPYFTNLPAWKLNLYDSATKLSEEIIMLSNEISKDYLNSLAEIIESIRIDAINLKHRNGQLSKQYWRKYYEIIESFTTPIDLYYDNRLIRKKSFDHGYAATVHKSQGKSFNNTFIDMKDIKICKNLDELRQLQYVSVSRARQNVYIYQ